jgi:hypothetical protein
MAFILGVHAWRSGSRELSFQSLGTIAGRGDDTLPPSYTVLNIAV